MEKHALLISANESYQKAEQDLETLTGIQISHSTLLYLDNVYCGAFFQNNQDLIDWSNSQKLLYPMYCIGDGHAGIWNLFTEIGKPEQRQEILIGITLRKISTRLGVH